MTIRFLTLGFALVAAPLGAQQDVGSRLAGRVSPELEALVQQLAKSAADRGLPVDPLIQKAIEGSAKGVPVDRVAVAVRAVAMQLDVAAAALRQGGLTPPDTNAIAAGAFALNAGLRERDLAELSRANGSPAATLRVAGTLAALGVPPGQTVALVKASIRAGRPAAELLALPAQLQAEVARGNTPAQAAAGLARAAAASSRRGPPPGHGPPQPAHPQRP